MQTLENYPLQVFYDEDMAFDISSAHGSNWGQWNQYKMVSQYREDMTVTVTFVGSTGALALDSHVGLVLLDDIVITIRKNSK